ncbi:MAG: PEP-CTERM sorting domain-containing protein [Bryobacteraceae bacterium]
MPTSRKPSARILVAITLVFGAASLCSAGTIIVGTPADSDEGNAFPFGGAFNGEYQQVYTNSLFSGPITITGLEFFNTQFNDDATAMNTGTFTISLSSTSADWDTLSSTPANNIGVNNTEVFSGSLAQPWAFGDTLTITFSTPFTYTPGPGANLLVDIVSTGTDDAGGLIFFDENGYNNGGRNGNTIFGREYDGTSESDPVSGVDSGFGLVTGFETTTPEPGTLSLFVVSLIGLAMARRCATTRRTCARPGSGGA